jgi:tetratricopeptide (TPR) repeat protein
MQALAADPSNPVALKNLGAILGQEGDSLRALYHLRRSFEADPKDPQTVNGLAFANMELGDIEQAQKRFQAVLEMEAPEELCGLARNGLSKIAARELQARGPRMDDSLLSAGCHAALSRQAAGGGPGDRLRDRDAGAARAGHKRPPGDIRLAGAAPAGSVLELLCIMYAGFKQFEPGKVYPGVSVGEKWGMAERLTHDAD